MSAVTHHALDMHLSAVTQLSWWQVLQR